MPDLIINVGQNLCIDL